jgi:urease accessory protein
VSRRDAAAGLPRLLTVLQLASPGLPVGGFAYSQGLETAIDARLVHDAATAGAWIGDVLTLSLARLEAPLWLRTYDAAAAGDAGALARWNEELLAARETAELRAESEQMGASLLRVFPALALAPPPVAPLGYAAAFACACAQAGIDRASGLTTYLWAWLENQVLVAVKSVPLGQQAGQTLLHGLQPTLVDAVRTAATLSDEDIGSAPVGLALASARHESQYSRLYRS